MPDTSGTCPLEVENLPDGSTAPLYVLRFDKAGQCESPQARTDLVGGLRAGAYTDVFLFSHGWNDSWDDALSLYRTFFHGYAELRARRGLGYPRPVRPLLVGVFWPSLALAAPAERGPSVAAPGPPEVREPGPFLHELATELGYEEAVELGVLLGKPGSLSGTEALQAARLVAPLYACAEDEIPGAVAPLSPEEIVALWQSAAVTLQETSAKTEVDFLFPPALPQATGLLPYLDPVWVVRLASVLQMKDRAGLVGARGVGPLLGEALAAAPEVRFHLVGHSYGCKMVLSALCQGPLPAGGKVESLLLLQPAVNYRCFAADAWGGQPGGYRTVLDRVRQPVLTTLTRRDFPLTRIFHLAVRRATDLGEFQTTADVTCAGRVTPSLYAALGGYGPGGCKPGECRPVVMNTDQFYDLRPEGSPRLIALNGDDALLGHGDVVNDYTCWALYNQVALCAPGAGKG